MGLLAIWLNTYLLVWAMNNKTHKSLKWVALALKTIAEMWAWKKTDYK